MKIGIISDVHANLYSLMEVYSKLEQEEAESVVCLGDIVGYGPHPNEVINFIKRKHMICLKGVYDSAVIEENFKYINENTINIFSLNFTRQEITKNNLHYLSNLPSEINMKFGNVEVKFIHKTPYMSENEQVEDFVICGCTHTAYNEKNENNKYIINPGSAGRPCENGKVSFGILEISDKFNNFKMLNSEYSYEKLQKDMRMLNFPEILIDSYNKK